MIPNNPEDITGAYLLEMEFPDRYINESNGFVTKNGQHIVIKSPSYASFEQVSYISELMQEFEDAIYSEDGVNPHTGKSYLEYIDLDSWVKKYLIEEIFKDIDSGLTSEYLYKLSDSIDSLIYAGPVWDYDNSMGNSAEILNFSFAIKSSNGLYAMQEIKIDKATTHFSYWYPKLYRKNDFYEHIVKVYEATFVPVLEEIIEHNIDSVSHKISISSEMNAIRWSKNNNINVVSFSTLEEHIEYIKTFLNERIEFLNSLWIEQTEYYTVRFIIEGYRDIYYSVIPGELLPYIPNPVSETKVFTGWYYEDSNIEFDANTQIYSDITLYANFTIKNINFIKFIYHSRPIVYSIVISGIVTVLLIYCSFVNKTKVREHR